ncbi:MAG: nidogen-like domain-containing protein, partial [Pseudomonadales bacterium]
DTSAAVMQNDGSSAAIAIGSSARAIGGGLADFEAFSVNIGGSIFDSFYVNENGNISFGSAFSGRPGNTDFLNSGVVMFAPFFADADVNANGVTPLSTRTTGSIGSNYTPREEGFVEPSSLLVGWDIGYNGQTSGQFNQFQVSITDASGAPGGAAGDFDLLFYHTFDFASPEVPDPTGIAWETGVLDDTDAPIGDGFGNQSAIVGISLGDGRGYTVAGSGTPGAFLGDREDCGIVPTTNLACVDLTFNFRGGNLFIDGTQVDLGSPSAVPAPGTLALSLFGLALLALRKR